MQTKFTNLKPFEAGIIGMIALGLVIIGMEIFISLQKTTQANVAYGVQVLDISNYMSEQTTQVGDIVANMNLVLEQFNLAFVEMFAIDEEFNQVAQFGEELNQTLVSLVENYAPAKEIASGPYGQVLGITTEINPEPLYQTPLQFFQDNNNILVQGFNNFTQKVNVYLNQ